MFKFQLLEDIIFIFVTPIKFQEKIISFRKNLSIEAQQQMEYKFSFVTDCLIFTISKNKVFVTFENNIYKDICR